MYLETPLNTTVSEEKEARLENSKAITSLREQDTQIRLFIDDVKSSIEDHKESSHTKIIDEVNGVSEYCE